MIAGIVVASLVTLLALVAPSAWLVVARRRALADPPPAQGRPELLEVAYLLGGRSRVVDTVIAGMCDDGRISVNESGKLKAERAVAYNPVERALLGRCGAEWSTSLRKVRTSLQFDPAVDALEGALVRRGMLVSPMAKQKWRRAADVQVGGLVLTAVGVVSLVLMPVTFVVPFVVLDFLVAGIVLRVLCRPAGPNAALPTPCGKAFINLTPATGPWSVRFSATHPEGIAGVVAVHGADGPEPDQVFLSQLRQAALSSTSAGSAGSYSKSAKKSSSSSASSSSHTSGGYACSGASSCSGHSGHSGHSSCSSSSCSSSSSSSSCGGGSSCSS
ncbi:TIGR04222 domain-containing membrane protein [Streptomyces roseifaciens]|uniref:TIGR04222 domain-containing membrane protein n=1 Tax=Streptomyces roseifaciens TaxID=1488406 RepID=UPI0007180150|nr:TIGR04222 domain-containing membrane protein [Streptomyces roseifaciens]